MDIVAIYVLLFSQTITITINIRFCDIHIILENSFYFSLTLLIIVDRVTIIVTMLDRNEISNSLNVRNLKKYKIFEIYD